MRLIKHHEDKVTEERTVPGLMANRIEYEVKGARGSLDYRGPKLSPEVWHPILAFFRWTQAEHASECQVRLYVNVKLGRWAAWAFPQAARTGMTARELPEQETAEQAKERFASWGSEPSDDWLYFGTVHHHCSASAFQSATDEQNERNQDGLHITVGRMDQERHDVHARFYLSGNAYEPDLSAFWAVPADLAEQLPAPLHHHLAMHQMGTKVEAEFPEVWARNLREQPLGRSRDLLPIWETEADGYPFPSRVDEALEDIHQQCARIGVGEDEWVGDLHQMVANEVQAIIVTACVKHRLKPEELFQALHLRLD